MSDCPDRPGETVDNMERDMKDIPARTIERMVLYKRFLTDLQGRGQKTIYSHELAALAHNSAAQVRRDLMTIGHTGSPRKGYDIRDMLVRIGEILDSSNERFIALAGVGNLGRAILSYFTYRHRGLTIVAAFDIDDTKTDRVISGCKCYPMDQFETKIRELGVTLGIITLPAGSAQSVADRMVAAGIRGILNFAPVPLKLPPGVSTDRIDIATTLEKLAYFADKKAVREES